MLAYVVNNIFGWQFWLGVLLSILVFLWLFYGGKNYEFVGLKPLSIGVDSNKYVDVSTYHKSDKSNRHAKKQYTAEPVDNTVRKKKHKKRVKFRNNIESHNTGHTFRLSSEQFDIEEPSTREYVCSIDSYDEEEITCKEVKSPRTLALGEHKMWTNKRRSRGEELCKKAIEDIYGKPFYTVRPAFLKNPETGRNLEIDIYNDEIRLGVEYNGISHYVFPNPYHKTYNDFINQIRRDQYKLETCDRNGVYLISVPYTVPLNYKAIKKYIEERLPEKYCMVENS